tara:strand:- start:646 stop:1551 length:906 start_codon:yes stop_codon:yes gene_type:complete
MNKYIIFFIFISLNFHAQQEGLFTQYMFNPAIFNPAYVVTKESPSFYLQQRNQWGNLEGSPKTFFLSYQHPSLFENLGIGLNLVNDNIGPVTDFNVSVDFSSLVRISENWNTSLGIKLAYNTLNVNFNLLNIYNPSDPYFATNIKDLSSFNFGFGIFVYSEKTYIGFSSPSVVKQNHFDNKTIIYKASDEQYYYLTAGHVINISEHIKLKPSTILRYVENLPIQMDVSVNSFFYDKLIVGLSYRLESSISATLGFYLSKSLLVGYSHDSETNRLRSFAGNSSEFFLRWEINAKEIVNPRFF